MSDKKYITGLTLNNQRYYYQDADATAAIKNMKLDAPAIDGYVVNNVTQEDGKITVERFKMPTELPAKDIQNTFSPTSSDPISGVGVNEALRGLDVDDTVVATQYVSGVSEVDGKITVSRADLPTTLPASDVSDWAKAATKPSYTASEVGALADTVTHLSGDIATTEKGIANGVATLDSDGKVPSSQLPSFVDDVVEYANLESFPNPGESGKIYVALDTNLTYRWGSTTYVVISSSLALGETSSTAYAGDKGKAVTDALATHKADTDIHITAAERVTWNSKQNALDSTQLNAVNSGITSAKVSTYDGYATTLDNKVDKVEGKGLSTNDYDATAVAEVAKIANKADKATTISGYGITNAYTSTEVDGYLDKKVDKIEGSTLISTTDLAQISTNKTDIATLNGDNTVTGSVDKKIKDALDGFDLSAYVPKTTTVNSKALSGNITLDATDVGAATAQDIKDAIDALDITDTEVDGQYISSVSETDGKISVKRGTLPTTLPASDVKAWAKADTKPSYTADEVGAIDATEKGVASGVATLDENGLIPTSQIPSSIDEILEYETKDKFPAKGETGKIYVALDTNLTYRWSGTTYVEISPSLALGETSSTAYAGDKGKQTTDDLAIHKGDVVSHITSEERTTWNAKQSALTDAQLTATNSGITADKVSTYDGYNATITGKADKATTLSGYGITDAYTATEVNGYLGNKVDKVEGASLISSSDLGQISTNKTNIETLNGADTVEGSVSKKIKDAIEGLDVTDTAVDGKYISSISETDGKISVTRADFPIVPSSWVGTQTEYDALEKIDTSITYYIIE